MTTSHDNEQLREAAGIDGSTEAVRAYLARGIDPNGTATGVDSALAMAVVYDRIEAVKVLIDAGAALDHAGHFGCRPIHYARSPEVARLLLDHGASLAIARESREDPLHELIKRADDVATARVLLDGGLEVIRYGVPQPEPSLLERGRAFVNAIVRQPVDEPPLSHLERAAWCQRPGLVWLLLERGGSPNELSARGDPAVFRAFELGWTTQVSPTFYEIVRIFLEAGADPNIKGNSNETLLDRIVARGDASLVALALHRGGDPHGAVDMFGRSTSLLISAASSGDLEVATVVLEANAGRVDDVGAGGYTALMAAAKEGHLAMIELLLRCGADPQRRNARAETALHLAALAHAREGFDRLVEAGCRISDERNDGWTPFDIACANNRVAIVQAVLERGVPIDRRVGASRSTALILACTYGATQVASLLRAHGADASLVDSEGKTADQRAHVHAEELREHWEKKWET